MATGSDLLTHYLFSSRKWFSKGFLPIILWQVMSQHERQGRCFPGNSNHGKALTSVFPSLPTGRKRTADAWALPPAGPQAPKAVSNLKAPDQRFRKELQLILFCPLLRYRTFLPCYTELWMPHYKKCNWKHQCYRKVSQIQQRIGRHWAQKISMGRWSTEAEVQWTGFAVLKPQHCALQPYLKKASANPNL